MKIALVTDWLTNLGWWEKVLKAISDIYPNAPIYTTVVNKEKIWDLKNREIRTSFLQKIPILNKKHQLLLPLLPKAIESLDLSEFDIIISFSSSIAKSVITNTNQIHICYIHSPMRYAWEPFFDKRFKKIPVILKPVVSYLLHKLRLWDKKTSDRPDLYIANSTTTQARVKKYYGLNTEVLYPPVELSNFKISNKEDYYLWVWRMVDYKKFDLIVNTFKELKNKKLILIWNGPERKKLEEISKDCKNIKFIGRVSDKELNEYYSKAKAFILPQKEDAGIVQLEAMASGTPVLAYKAWGALDVVKEDVNWVFFVNQSVEDLIWAINKFETLKFDSNKIRESVEKYDIKKFQERFELIVNC